MDCSEFDNANNHRNDAGFLCESGKHIVFKKIHCNTSSFNHVSSKISRLTSHSESRKQLSEALINDDCIELNHMRSIVMAANAIDSIFHEMGFLGFYPNSIDKYIEVRNNNSSLYYTLPEIENQSEYVMLKFENSTNFINVSGSLARGGARSTTIYILPLKQEIFSRAIETRKMMIEILNNVKDNLALPLLIDLCEKAGFVPPACFSGLPGELKLKIMEFLPGKDVARLSCVSSELRDLGLTEDLWKMKFVHEFGDVISKPEMMSTWRTTYSKYWKRNWEMLMKNTFPLFSPYTLFSSRSITSSTVGERESIFSFKVVFNLGDPNFGLTIVAELGWRPFLHFPHLLKPVHIYF